MMPFGPLVVSHLVFATGFAAVVAKWLGLMNTLPGGIFQISNVIASVE